MIAERTKRCCHCKTLKTLVEFRRNRTTPDGLQFCCKTCQSEQQKCYLSTSKGRDRQRAAQQNYLKTESGKIVQKQSNQKWINKMRAAGYFRFGKGKIQNLKSAAKRRALEIKISGAELENWWRTTPHVCVYCGQSGNEYKKTANDLVSYEGTNRLMRLLKGKLNRLKQALAYDLTNS